MKLRQIDLVRSILLSEGRINNLYAFNHYVLRLGAVIHKLKQEGMEIEGEYMTLNGEKSHIYEYRLKNEH